MLGEWGKKGAGMLVWGFFYYCLVKLTMGRFGLTGLMGKWVPGCSKVGLCICFGSWVGLVGMVWDWYFLFSGLDFDKRF